ncbi:MAG: PQQ-dependent sugar dehydrogenase, partial [Gemmatimonadales bacterium]
MGRAMSNPLAIVLLVVPTTAACSDPGGPSDCCGSGDTELAAELVVEGLSSPLYLTAPAGDSRLFVVEQAGRVRIVENGEIVGEPFLDITDRVDSGGERGLLSIAFHPDYASNGYFYVDYTGLGGDTRIERYSVTGDPNVADPGSADSVLYVEQPFGNHNGGLILFGPDGMLYVGLGDGGSAGDPQGNGQNRGTLLGTLLRIDVNGGDPFAVPADNPFVDDPNA